MTVEEVKDMFEAYVNGYGISMTSKAYHTIQKALEKQTPKKPILITKDLIFEADECPACGNIINNKHKPNYCEYCGQRIDQSEE